MVEWCHFVITDGILKGGQRVLFCCWAGKWLREGKDRLAKREHRVAEILWFAHLGRQCWARGWSERVVFVLIRETEALAEPRVEDLP